MQKEELDNGTYLAELSETGTLWLTNDVNKQELKLTPRAAWDLLELLYRHREELHQAIIPEIELPEWARKET
jgi:hypothetical protein